VKLLDTLKEKYDLKNDAAISKTLEVAPPVISRIRNGKAPVSAELMIKIHETFGMPIADIKALCE
jgi:plasmid maintenance system antidote protein VapI